MPNNFNKKVSFIWSVADLLRGPYTPNRYKDVMLPLIVLRRLDCVLESTKDDVLYANKKWSSKGKGIRESKLIQTAGVPFYNTSRYTLEKLKGDPDNIAPNLINYIKGFSPRVRDIIVHFEFEEQIAKLDKADRLFRVVSKFCDIDLHPDKVSNIEMGYIFEELIRKFNETSNEEAGDHFTPREVIRLMVNLIFMPDKDVLTTKGIVKTLYDPACGTGGMLSVAEEYLRELNPDARLEAFGQDYNGESFAVCGSDMMIKDQNIGNIAFGNTFLDDRFAGKRFDYMLANPPFGVEWKPESDQIKNEHEQQGFGGRFGAGLPRIDDGSLLFLQHMISKMKLPQDGGTRLAIVFNGSPLFAGSAGSGASEIRRWIIENDWLEAIVALPNQLFYNTDIYTYLWIVTNRKAKSRKGKIQLVDGTSFFKKMSKSLGNKRNEICDEQRDEITRLYGTFKAGEYVRVFNNEDFGYRRITVERPLRLNFVANKERIDRLKQTSAFQNLATSKKRQATKAAQDEIKAGRKLQKLILSALNRFAPKRIVKSRDKFSSRMKACFKKADLKILTPLFKAILMALAERDETAEACIDSKGNPEPDSKLRDYENVPLTEDVSKYFKREVLPHRPDAWIDESKTKIGYEISFNRYFYSHKLPRPLDQIEDDLRQIEKEIADMLTEVTE
ncbi:MAG: type I restriction-modification system subunit M [Pseudohongiellaceae bacterium]